MNETIPVEAAVPAEFLAPRRRHAYDVHCARSHHIAAFTLAELLVSCGVLVLLVLLFTQLLNSAATITTLGHKQMDADSQARQLLDRMAIDFAQLVKRNDVDFFAKGTVRAKLGGRYDGWKRSDSVLQRCSGLLSIDWFAKPCLTGCLSG